MVFKLGMEAQKHWRRLNGPELVTKVVIGVKFIDGEEQTEQAAHPVNLARMRLFSIRDFGQYLHSRKVSEIVFA